MSLNHHAFMAIMVHMEVCGVLLCLLLDVVEVAKVHTGMTLADEFKRILEEFCIVCKVSKPLVKLFSD
jgi:hypothetical protein